jgi:hypothetical protein
MVLCSVMKYLPQTKKQIILTSAIAVVIVAMSGAATYALTSNKPETQTSNAIIVNSEEAPKAAEETVRVVNDTKPSEQVENVTPVQSESPAAPAPSQPAPATTAPAEDTAFNTLCSNTSDFINARYVQKKDMAGNPWYQDNAVLLKDLSNSNAYMFSTYNRCVAAGKIQAL